VPKRIRPKFPKEWNVPDDPKYWVTWREASGKLGAEKVYWVSTSRKNGRPHAAPVWGIWKDGTFFFETDPDSVKGRNLSRTGQVVVHTQDGMRTVILEGKAKRETSKEKLSSLAKEYVAKYDYKPDWTDKERQIVFRVEPVVVHAWNAPRMHRSLVKFVF
jgi:general stress protein 26